MQRIGLELYSLTPSIISTGLSASISQKADETKYGAYSVGLALDAQRFFGITTPEIVNNVIRHLTPRNAFRFLLHTSKALRKRVINWNESSRLTLPENSQVTMLDTKTIYYAVSAGVEYNNPYYGYYSHLLSSGSAKPSTYQIYQAFKSEVTLFKDKTSANGYRDFKREKDNNGEIARGHFIKPCQVNELKTKNRSKKTSSVNEFAILSTVETVQLANLTRQTGMFRYMVKVMKVPGKELTYLEETKAGKSSKH